MSSEATAILNEIEAISTEIREVQRPIDKQTELRIMLIAQQRDDLLKLFNESKDTKTEKEELLARVNQLDSRVYRLRNRILCMQ